MRVKKLVSALSALAMTVTAMAGLAVNAGAAENAPDRTYTGLDQVIFSDKSEAATENFEKSMVAGETIRYEFDLYVPNGSYMAVTYQNDGRIGPKFIFDATEGNNQVQVKFNTGSDTPINSNAAYSYYLSDAWVHVTIQNTLESDSNGAYTSIGNATINVTAVDGNEEPFTQIKDGSPIVRHPNNGSRTISARNIHSGRSLNRMVFDFGETLDGIETPAQVENQCLYTVSSKLTVNAPNATISGLPTDTKSYDAVSGLIANNTYKLTITPNENYTLDAVKVNGTEVEATEGIYTVTVNADTTVDVETTEVTPPEPVAPEVTTVEVKDESGEAMTDVAAFATKTEASVSEGQTLYWNITATKGEETKHGSESIKANLETAVKVGLIVYNIPEGAEVTAELGYTPIDVE